MKHALLGAGGLLLLALSPAHADCFPIFGTDGPDVLTAQPGCGDTKLIGLGGGDTLIGGAGDDVLWGDACSADEPGGDCVNGADTMTGGAGRDAFAFNKASESRHDHIDLVTDFTPGEDLIAMGGVCYHASRVSCRFIGTDPFTGEPGEVRYRVTYQPSPRPQSHVAGVPLTIVTADLDGDGAADFEVHLNGALALSAGDFLLDGFPPDLALWAPSHRHRR